MNDQQLDLLRRMIAAPSPSGYEQPVMRILREEAAAFAARVVPDVHGNCDVVLNPGGSPRVMLAAHCDEIGLITTYIDEHGFLSVGPIGGWDPQILQGQRVRVITANGPVPGVIGKQPIHVQEPADRDKVSKLKTLWVDIGAKDREDAERLVSIGDPMVVASDLAELPNGRFAGRAFDDKAGAWTVFEAARRLSAMPLEAEVHAVFTVQEEIGSRGAATAAFGIRPDAGIAVDVTFATDHPGMSDAEKTEGHVVLGGGPAVTRGANVNPELFRRLKETAEAKGIPLQIVADGRATPTDADPLQVSRAGVATALLAVPLRYMHTPCEIVSADDLEATARLMAETIASFKKGDSFLPL